MTHADALGLQINLPTNSNERIVGKMCNGFLQLFGEVESSALFVNETAVLTKRYMLWEAN